MKLEHICERCANKEFCQLGKTVSEGTYDEYIREKLSEDFDEPEDFYAFIAITRCKMFCEVKSKWEWIADACRMNGYEKSAELAEQIEEQLKTLYDNTITEAWREDYQLYDPNPSDILEVAFKTSYCIGCVIHQLECKSCAFGRKAGICHFQSSLFRQFIETFREEAYLSDESSKEVE